MYTGHVAIALGARAARRDVPLWILVVAAQGPDWVERLLGDMRWYESAQLWSHAFPGVLLAALGLAAVVALWKRSAGAGVLVLAVYLSHPILDLVTGYKPLWLGGPDLGLSLVQRAIPDLLIQGSLCVAGYFAYSRTLQGSRAHRALRLAPLVLLLSLQTLSDVVVAGRELRRRARPAAVATSGVGSREGVVGRR